MVVVGTGKSGSRFIKTDWPITEGLTAGTTKQYTKESYLVPQEKSLISEKQKVGLD
jgi:hypothetical protein